jgi:ubiquinone/menaquinone biosynthesis C-methylase UbiE
MKSTDVKSIYDKEYFINAVDGCREFDDFNGSYSMLYERYKKNVMLLELIPQHNFLEIGCGRGEICIFHSLSGGRAKGVDYSDDAIKLARHKALSLGAQVDFVESSFDQLEEQYGSYDRILASEFIEHISEDEGRFFFRKAYDFLKPKGKLLVFTYPNTLYRRYGYPIIRYWAALHGRRLPRHEEDTLSEHYKLYHLNEQNYFSLKTLASEAGFIKFTVGYDSANTLKPNGIKGWVKKILFKTPFRHIFLSNLYVLAEK